MLATEAIIKNQKKICVIYRSRCAQTHFIRDIIKIYAIRFSINKYIHERNSHNKTNNPELSEITRDMLMVDYFDVIAKYLVN